MAMTHIAIQEKRDGKALSGADWIEGIKISHQSDRGETCDLLILDTPGGVNDETLAVARMAHLIVQPTV